MDAPSSDETINPAPSGDSSPSPASSRRGGRRPGAGRPKGAKDGMVRITQKRAATFRERYETEVEKHARQLIEAAIKAGIRGDSRMLLDMVTRFVGPARSSVEISGPNGAPLQLQAMTAAALVTLTDAQLDALAAFHGQLGPVATGDSSPLSLLPPREGAPAPPGTLADPSDSPGHAPTELLPASQLDPQTSQEQQVREGENGGSSSSQPTAPAGTDGSSGPGPAGLPEGGESVV